MAQGWNRLESMARSVELTGGLEARIADPMWLLSRQWQVGEFRGDDAAQPAAVRLRRRSALAATFRPGATAGAEVVPFPTGRPLEAVVEATPEPDLGPGRLHASARAGRRLLRMLRESDLPAAVTALRAAFPLRPGAEPQLRAADRDVAALLARHGVDGAAVAARPARARRELAGLPEADALRARDVLAAWLRWYARRGGTVGEGSWDDERLEHAFTVGVRGPRGEVVLRAPEHTGELLDWSTFDVAAEDGVTHGLALADLPVRPLAAVPTPVRYTGMPVSRWWEFEDAAVHFGDLDAGPADLARLVTAEFATSFGTDWFVLPVTVPVGSLTELLDVEVVDTFGGRTPVPSTALADQVRTGGRPRAFRLFELTGDEPVEGHPAPWLFVPPSLAGGLDGPALERVTLTRDEAANLAWGIEGLVEGPLGRAVDRAEAWYASQPPGDGAGREPLDDDRRWRYRLEATAPPWWIPFVPERTDPATSAEVRLRRARMQAWALLGAGTAGPQSVLLDRRRPRWLHEEEVPTGGVRVERGWQLGRWHDGSLHVWLQRRKRPGRGDATSGVRWDLLERSERAPTDPAPTDPDAG